MKLKGIHKILIDIDGTIVHKANPDELEEIEGASLFFDKVEERSDISVKLISNNSRMLPSELSKSLHEAGLHIDEQDIITPLSILNDYLRRENYHNIYVIGEMKLTKYLSENGYNVSEEDIDCVLMGLDFNISYQKLMKACTAVSKGSALVALHKKLVYKESGGRVGPGLGALVSAVEKAVDKKAVIIGKPSTTFMNVAIGQETPAKVLVISDDIPDIVESQRLGCITALVLSGNTKKEDIDSTNNSLKPDYVFDHIGEAAGLL